MAGVRSWLLLHCYFMVSPGPIDPSRLTVTWLHRGQALVQYHQRNVNTNESLILSEDLVESGNASLLLWHVSIDDEGQYKCGVRHRGEKGEANISVSVVVPPQVFLLLDADPQSSQGNLTCVATEFYPPDITFSFKRKGVTLKTERMTLGENPFRWILGKDIFTVENVYTLDVTTAQGDVEPFTCEVTHSSVERPITRDLTKPGD